MRLHKKHSAKRFTLTAALLICYGCQQYQEKKLTSDAVEKQLAAPDDHALRVATTQLSHPLLAPLPVELEHGLSPDEAAVVAVIVNPQLRAERDQRNIASAQLLQAGILPNPQLTGGLDFPYDSSPPDNFTAYNVGLNWEVTSLLTRDEKRRAASATLASVHLDVAWKEWQIAQAARTAAYDAIALEQQLLSARQADQQLAENLAVVRRALDQHEKTLLDLAAAETSAQDAHAAVISQEKDLAKQRLMLNRALGVTWDRQIKLRDAAELPSSLSPPPVAELLFGLEERRLDLLALRRGYESEDATLRAAVLAQFPKINLGFTAARDTMNVRTLGFGVTIDIPLFDRNQGVIAQETATRQKLFDEYVNRLFEARSDVATAVTEIKGTNAQIAAAEAAIPRLEKLVQTYQAELKQRNVDILSYYTARGSLLAKRIDLLKLKQQLIQNWIALGIASGRNLPLQISTSAPPAPAPHGGER